MQNRKPQSERVAIIGIGLTLPGGVNDQTSFWELLEQKTDATVEIPKDRWDSKRFYSPYGSEKPGKMYVTRGGFLHGKAGEFDPLFFGISPREASVMDFQQRLLLEVAAKTFQDAGVTEENYTHSNMGVFIGGFCMDASIQAASIYNRNWCITQSVTGSTATLLSNRLSYVFDLRGPSLTIDTACSSSLVAAHYAVESILSGECDSALVGGVNVMTQPEHFIEMCKSKLLSKDGRCFTWDKRANGYARGEGAGMLLLKSLSAAIRDNDHIYAIIEASGVNQDGTTKGITLPNPDAQTELITKVLKKAGLTPSDIDYVEAHGTGTQAGDKAETSALNNVFAKDRADKLIIGSVKTNIGHLEAAAGVSGLLKAILCLQNGKIPANLNFETPNPDIPFDTMCLKVPTEIQDWPRKDKTKYVGVNAFGYGGTNAHIVLSEAPKVETLPSPVTATTTIKGVEAASVLLPLSAKSAESLAVLATQYKTFLEEDTVIVDQFLRRVSTKRNHYERRALIHAHGKNDLITKLERFSKGIITEGVISEEPSGGPQNLVFVYSGMGPQWWGMGRELLVNEPLFAKKINEYDEVFQKISGWSLLTEMLAGEENSRVARTEIAQPLNFAIQAGLTALWQSWGIQPAAVVGHSVGEVTSAYVSGILSLEDALLISYHRSRLQATLAGTGGMLAVGLSQKAVESYLKPHVSYVSIAAVNSPNAVTLAGDQSSLEELAKVFTQENIFNRILQVEVPYHSPLMEPIEADIQACLDKIKPQTAIIPCYSTVSGKIAKDCDYDAAYWWRNVRESVLFADAIGSVCDEGLHSFLEIGPHPVLGISIKEILADRGIGGHVYSSLNRKTPEQSTLLNSLGRLYCQGYRLNWQGIQKADDVYFQLPIYPWKKDTYDHGSPKFHQDKFGESSHPILYRNLQLPYPSWEVELSDALFPYIKDHQIGNKIILPGAFYVEAALALSEKKYGNKTGGLKNLSFERILALPDEKEETEKRIISMYSPENNLFKIYSTTTAQEETWTFHMRGEFAPATPKESPLNMAHYSFEDFQEQNIASFYKTISNNGLQYGSYFQPIKKLKSKDNIVYAELENTLLTMSDNEYILPPPILDGVFQTLFVFGGKYQVPFIPVKIDHLIVREQISERCKVFGKLLWMTAKSLKADFTLFDENNNSIVEIKGVTCQALSQIASSDQNNLPLYHTAWEILNTSELDGLERLNDTLVIITDKPTSNAYLIERLSFDNKVFSIDLENWSRQSFQEILQNEDVTTVIYLSGQPAALNSALKNSVNHCTRLIEITQVLNQTYSDKDVKLLLCTRHACKVLDSDSVEGVSLSSLVGFGRTINTEYPHIKCSTIDFTNANKQEMEKFYEVVLCNELGIQELAIRGGNVYQHELVILEPESMEIETIESQVWQRVVIDDFTSLEHGAFTFKAHDRVLPQNIATCGSTSVLNENEIEIEVVYMTLSQWDQLNGQLSIYPDDPARHYFEYKSGMQCVGTIVNKGAAVSDLMDGDQVLSLHPHGITNFTVIAANHAFKIPASLHNTRLPDIYEMFRARYAMTLLGNLAEGATLLIKGRWGAFVQTLFIDSQAAGLKVIFVDEDSSSRVQTEVEALPGVQYLACEDGKWTDELSGMSNGIDIFINQGWKNLDNLKHLNIFAKVVDFKSSQILRNHLDVLPTSNSTYHVIDTDTLFRDHFAVVKPIIEKLLSEFETRRLILNPLPAYHLRHIADAASALKAGSTSAVQILMKGETVPLVSDATTNELLLKGTYIVTGGTQGFGLQCAQWLVQKGARHLVLISRSGLIGQEDINAVNALKHKGVSIKVCSLDITNYHQLQEDIAIIKNTMPAIKGVIHSAMVLDDCYLSQMNESRLQRVMAPKIQGAINLHLVLQNEELDFFVMFSSISSLIGNSGQGNYVAANNFLDSFAYYLSNKGIPAKTINWGALSDTGVLSKNEALIKVLDLAGIKGVTNAEAMAGMEAAISGNASQTGIFRVDWNQWSLTNPSLSQSGFYRKLLSQQDRGAERHKLMEILENIIHEGTEGRKSYIQRELAIRFGAIFKMSPDAINPHTSIIDFGVDSLMSAEISMALKAQLDVDITPIDLISGPSIAMLATKILAQIEALIDEVMNEDTDDGITNIAPRMESEEMSP